MNDLIPVIALLRVSTAGQAGEDRYGLPVQMDVCREVAKREGLRIIRTEQITISGTETMLTPEMGRILDSLKRGEARGVVTREYSRLMRPERYEDWGILQVFQDTHAKLYIPEGPIDFNDPEGQLMANIRGTFAGFERTTILKRLKAGAEKNRKSGGRNGVLSLGVTYDKASKRWSYTEDAKLVREAYSALLNGESFGDVARILGKTRTGMRSVLSNPIYKGWLVYAHEMKTERLPNGTKKQRRVRRPEENIIRIRVIDEPLVSEKEWDRAQRMMAERRESHRRDCQAARQRRVEQGRPSGAMYSGFMYCDHCGRIMTPQNGNKNKIFYVCIGRARYRSGCPNKYVLASKLEQNIDHIFGTLIVSPAFRRRLAMHLERSRADKASVLRLDRLQAGYDAIEYKRARILENYDDGHYTKEQRDSKLAKLDQQRRDTASELERAKSEMLPALDETVLQSFFETFAAWPMLDLEDRRRLLTLAAPRLRVRDGQVVSFYRPLADRVIPIPSDVDFGAIFTR